MRKRTLFVILSGLGAALLVVDDLDAFLARLKAKGVTILKRDDSDPNGKFAWILDPDGTKIELSQSTKR